MIIRYIGKTKKNRFGRVILRTSQEYIVVAIYSDGDVYVYTAEGSSADMYGVAYQISSHEIFWVNPEIPPNWRIHLWSPNFSSFYLTPDVEGFNDEFLSEYEYYNEEKTNCSKKTETDKQKKLLDSVDKIRAFHGLPMLNRPFKYNEPTERERRQKIMNDELEEYLKLGEEE